MRVVEIKVPGHKFATADYDRLEHYVEAFRQFFTENKQVSAAFAEGWQIDLVCDGVNLTNTTQKLAFDSFVKEGLVVRQTWDDFLASATRAHEEFLNITTKPMQDSGSSSSEEGITRATTQSR